jgi:hypothetical protein
MRYKWSEADFDPVFFPAEGECSGSTKGVLQRDVEHAVQRHTLQEWLTRLPQREKLLYDHCKALLYGQRHSL